MQSLWFCLLTFFFLEKMNTSKKSLKIWGSEGELMNSPKHRPDIHCWKKFLQRL